MMRESGTRPNFLRSFGSRGPIESSRLLIEEYLADFSQSPSDGQKLKQAIFPRGRE